MIVGIKPKLSLACAASLIGPAYYMFSWVVFETSVARLSRSLALTSAGRYRPTSS